ncbi:MAG: hypothetical protein EON50_07115 [Acidovorax sp.]|nr:MAG: hypothetical protein EON50_07115 [Acidovorax sp.]
MVFSAGRVVGNHSDGTVTVDLNGQTVVAVLATHIPHPLPGQRVVVMIGATDAPLIFAAYPLATDPGDADVIHTADASTPVVSFEPETGILNIQANQINLTGLATIEIRCGESVLRFNAQGEVFMHAEAVTQSAVGPYRIEGASIDLN